MEQGENDNYTWQKLTIDATRGSTSVGTLEPARRFYKSSQQPTSEVDIRRRLNEDLYVNFAGVSTDNQRAVVQAYVFPLVSWVWIGFWVLAMGTLVCLIPSKVRLSYARTQVLGLAEKHAKVTK
jgi:cytochrome c-type biogenesis protein CcmF